MWVRKDVSRSNKVAIDSNRFYISDPALRDLVIGENCFGGNEEFALAGR